MYIANHYVRVNGKMLVRGERIPKGLPQDKIDWLLSAGAITEFAPASPEGPAEVPEETEDVTEDTQKPAKEQEEGVTQETDDVPGEEADDEAEAPEIDVMSGIVAGDSEEEPKKTARRTSAKKQTGRRK